ncbi:MAG: hypothetical protein V1921_06360 [Candidatus Altiarchaeota archaeon]
MAGTKIVKLRLQGGSDDRLPSLKDSIVPENVIEAASTAFEKSVWSPLMVGMYDEAGRRIKEADPENVLFGSLNSGQIQTLYQKLEESFKGDKEYDYKMGTFITQLMQRSTKSEFKLKVSSLLQCFGMNLSGGKKITVEGDLGNYAGLEMSDGQLIVDGSVGAWAGQGMTGGYLEIGNNASSWLGFKMNGGKIVVKGNVGDFAGERMDGGKIFVHGNAGKYAANFMKDGLMDIRGDVEEFGKIAGGTVHHRGRKVKT